MAKLDRDPPERGSEFANRPQLSENDSASLETGLARSVSAGDTAPIGSVESDEIREKSVGTRPVSDRTDFRTSGTGAIETDDGLDEMSDRVREESEDTIERQPYESDDDEAVFDKGEGL